MTPSLGADLLTHATQLLAGTGTTLDDALNRELEASTPAAAAIRDGWDAAANPAEPHPDEGSAP